LTPAFLSLIPHSGPLQTWWRYWARLCDRIEWQTR